MSTIQTTDAESAAFYKAPRVSLADIETAIACRYDFPADRAVTSMGCPSVDPLKVLSICILVMRNGFTVIGKSAPASPENFNSEYGIKLAYEDAVRQLWPLMGFSLRDKLSVA